MRKHGKQIEIYVPYNAKIADITHADTNKHTLDLATALSESRTITAVYVATTRVSGSGALRLYPNEGSDYINHSNDRYGDLVIIAAGTNRLQYQLTNANDDFDMYGMGYVVKQ